jgi:hypothetical protein
LYFGELQHFGMQPFSFNRVADLKTKLFFAFTNSRMDTFMWLAEREGFIEYFRLNTRYLGEQEIQTYQHSYQQFQRVPINRCAGKHLASTCGSFAAGELEATPSFTQDLAGAHFKPP